METAVSKNRYLKQLKDGWVKDEPYVFVSYASRDWEKVYPTVLALRALGINVYIDVEFMENQSSSWLDNFQDQMIWNMDCVGIVTFLSISYLRSYACLMEQLANRTSTMRERRGGPLPVFYMALEPEMETVQRMQQYIYSKEVAKEGRARVKMQPPEAALFQEFILKCGYSQYPDADAVRNMLGEIRDQHAVVTKAYWLIFEDLQYLIRPFCSPKECAEQLAGNFTNHKNASILMMPSEELKQETLRRLSETLPDAEDSGGQDYGETLKTSGTADAGQEVGPEPGSFYMEQQAFGAADAGQEVGPKPESCGMEQQAFGTADAGQEVRAEPGSFYMEKQTSGAADTGQEVGPEPGSFYMEKQTSGAADAGQEVGPESLGMEQQASDVAGEGQAEVRLPDWMEELCERALDWDIEEDGYTPGMWFDGKAPGREIKAVVDAFYAAAKQGCAAAQNVTGHCCMCGLIEGQGKKQAVEWYRKAAEQKYAPAQKNLGDYYGGVCDEDEEETIRIGAKWLRRMANEGEKEAKSRLCSNWERSGIGKNETVEEELEYLNHAAAQGNAAAEDVLNDYYIAGMLKACPWEMMEWNKKAAEQGYAPAWQTLGYCYEHGVGVEQDARKAAESYEKADALRRAAIRE